MSVQFEDINDFAIEDIHIEAAKANPTYFCRNFKIYPEGKERFGGFLFGIIEIKATPTNESEKIFQTMLNTLTNNYYKQITNSPTPQKLNLETIFEFALNKTNQKIIEMIEIGQIKIIKENINFFIGLAKPQKNSTTDIFFTNQGMINAFLLHRTKKNNYKAINIIEDVVEPPESTDKVKIFSAITAGQLATNDTLLISTELFVSFISTQKILHIITNNALPQAIAYFKSQIKQGQESNLTHSVLILKREHRSTPNRKPLAQKSLDNLITTTQTTEKLLTPTVTLNVKKNIREVSNKIKKLFKRSDRTPDKKQSKITKEATPKQRPERVSNKPKADIILTFLKGILAMIQGRGKISLSQIKDAVANPTKKKQGKHVSAKRFRLSPKLIGIAIVIVIAMLWTGISWNQKQKVVKEAEAAYAAQIESIRTLIDDAEVSFVYRNTEQSLEKIKIATTELEALPKTNEIQQKNYTELETQISTIKNKLFNIEKVIPQTMTSLKINGQSLAATALIVTNDTIFAQANDTLATISIKNKALGNFIDAPQPIKAITQDENTLYAILNNNEVYKITNSALVKMNTTLTTNPTALAAYNSSLYTVQAADQAITKYQGIPGGFGAARNWIQEKNNADLTTSVDIAIDGNIYILAKNGIITKFYAGSFSSFNNPVIEPAITNATHIITSTEIDKIYILEPQSKRLIVLNKSGSLIKQLVFDTVSTVTDIAISPDGKTGYLLAVDTIYSFPL